MSDTQPSPEHILHNEFCLFGSHYLGNCREKNLEVDPKIYETIYKYLSGKDLEVLPTPESGSLAEKKMQELRDKKGE